MTIQARLGLLCSICSGHYRQDARSLKPGAMTTCPYCSNCVELDPEKPEHALIVHSARKVRRERRARVEDLKAGWISPVAETAEQEPYHLGDKTLFSTLDTLLRKLDVLMG